MLRSSGLLLGMVAALMVVGPTFAYFSTGSGRSLAPQTYAAKQASEPGQGQDNQGAAMAEALGKGAQRNAEAIAKQFNMTPQDVVALHNEGFGYGAIVKLAVLARAKGVSVNSLAASLPRVNGKPEANFGELMDKLSPAEKARIDGLPKNLGQIKQAQAGKGKPK